MTIGRRTRLEISKEGIEFFRAGPRHWIRTGLLFGRDMEFGWSQRLYANSVRRWGIPLGFVSVYLLWFRRAGW